MQRFMTVLKMQNVNKQELIEIDLYDVDFIETEKRKIVYHVGDQKYYQITNINELGQCLNKEGFDSLDRTNLVNLRKIRKFDEVYGKVYFVENPTPNSKFATVARIKYKFIKKLLKRVISHNNDTTSEIKVEPKGIKSKMKELFNKE